MSSIDSGEICLVPLKDLGTWCGGGTPSKRQPAYWENGTIPWVSPKDMKVEHIRGAEDSITEKAIKESTTNLLPSGAVLTVTRSGILRHTFPVAVTDVPVTINQDLKALVPNAEIDPRYVAFALRAFSREILNKCSKQGTTVNSIETKELLRFRIPLFPYDHQQRIVAEIEKQFSRLDQAVANLKRVMANLKRYKAAVLKAAVEGKLTEEWRKQHPDVEPADKLLERILAERREKWQGRGKYKEPAAPDTTDLPELPEGWVWASTISISDVIGGLTKNRKREELPNKFPYLRVGNVYANELRLEEIFEIGVADKELEKLLLKEGDLLVVEGNGSPEQIGRLAIWDGSISPCVHQNHLIKVRLSNGCLSKWALNWFLSPAGRSYIRNVASSTSGLYTLSVSKIGNLPLALPPIEEQQQIVIEIERCLSIVAGTEAQIDTNLRRADRLRQSILSRAFSGRRDNDSSNVFKVAQEQS